MASRYLSIWTQLKNKKKAVVRCRAAKAATLIQAVKKQKAKENAPKVALDLPSFGKLQVKSRELADGMAEITFNLTLLARAEDL